MNAPNQVPTLNFKKLGLLAMTPIALVIHGLVLWIPVNTETKKEKEPEKKEELQAIGDIVSIAAPIATPSPKATASTPTANPSTAATSPVVIEKIIEKVIETQPAPQSKPSESTKPPITPIPPIAPLVPPEVTPEGTLQALLTGVPCPGVLRCTEVSQPQGGVLATLEKQYGNEYEEITDVGSFEKGKRPEESQVKGYRIKNNKTNNFIYFVLPPTSGTNVRFLVRKNEEQVIKYDGIS